MSEETLTIYPLERSYLHGHPALGIVVRHPSALQGFTLRVQPSHTVKTASLPSRHVLSLLYAGVPLEVKRLQTDTRQVKSVAHSLELLAAPRQMRELALNSPKHAIIVSVMIGIPGLALASPAFPG